MQHGYAWRLETCVSILLLMDLKSLFEFLSQEGSYSHILDQRRVLGLFPVMEFASDG